MPGAVQRSQPRTRHALGHLHGVGERTVRVVGAVQEMDVDERDVSPLLFYTGKYGSFAPLD